MGKISLKELAPLFEAADSVVAAREERDSYSKVYGKQSAGAVDRRARVRYHEKRVVELAILLFTGGAHHAKR